MRNIMYVYSVYILTIWAAIEFIGLSQYGVSSNFLRRDVIQRVSVIEGDTLSLACSARPNLLRSYRWVYIRDGARKPKVLTSGRRLVVGEDRMSIEAETNKDDVNLVLTLEDIRPYESGLYMCWRQGLKPEPQVFVRVLKPGAMNEEVPSVEISNPDPVEYGSSTEISCLIKPSWPGKVIWRKDGQSIELDNQVYTQYTEEDSDGNLASYLKIASIRQEGQYTCHIPSSPPVSASTLVRVRVPKIESLTLDPPVSIVNYGEALTATCIASGTDSQIVWLKNGNNILENLPPYVSLSEYSLVSDELKSVLEFNPFSIEDVGLYACYVPGDSKGALLNIEGRIPRIIDVTGTDFRIGESLKITCATQYIKNYKNVEWLYEEESLPEHWDVEITVREASHNITYHDLVLSAATENHGGNFTCLTPFSSRSIHVRPIVDPYLVETPQVARTVEIGEPIRLDCNVAGHPTPQVSWEKLIDSEWLVVDEAIAEGYEEVQNLAVSIEITDHSRKVDIVHHRISTNEGLPIHSGRYRCRSVSLGKEVTALIELLVTDKVTKVLNVSAEKVEEGSTLKIKCVVKNWEEPVAFVHGFKMLGTNGDIYGVNRHTIELDSIEEKVFEKHLNNGQILEVQNTLYTYILFIKNVTLEDRGFYECHAGPESSKAIKVVIKELPPKIIEIAHSPAIYGDEFFISCTVENMPTDEKITFFFENRTLNINDTRYSIHLAELTDEIVTYSKGRAKLATYILRVQNTSWDDAGIYTCSISGETESFIYIDVQGPESIGEISLEVSMNKNDLILKCYVFILTEEVTLFHNDTLLPPPGDNRIIIEYETFTNGTLTTFTLPDVSPKDGGLYQCFAGPLIFAEALITINKTDFMKFVDFPHEEMEIFAGENVNLICSAETTSVVTLTHASDFNLGKDMTDEIFASSYNSSSVVVPSMLIKMNWRKKGEEQSMATNTGKVDLILWNVTMDDAGTYVCEAEFMNEMITAQTHLKIIEKNDTQIFNGSSKPTLDPGKLVQINGAENLTEGDDFNLTCILSPLLAYYENLILLNGIILIYDNSLVASDPRMNVSVRRGAFDEIILNFLVKNIGKNDQGVYECAVNTDPATRDIHFLEVAAENYRNVVIGQTTTDKHPDILAPPTKTTLPSNNPEPTNNEEIDTTIESTVTNETAIVSKGDSTFMECSIQGSEVLLTWKKEHAFSPDVTHILTLTSDDDRYEVVSPNPFTSNLFIHRTQEDDAGIYLCFAGQSSSKLVHRVELIVSDGMGDIFYDSIPNQPLETTIDSKTNVDNTGRRFISADDHLYIANASISPQDITTDDLDIMIVPDGYDPSDFKGNEVYSSTPSYVNRKLHLDNVTKTSNAPKTIKEEEKKPNNSSKINNETVKFDLHEPTHPSFFITPTNYSFSPIQNITEDLSKINETKTNKDVQEDPDLYPSSFYDEVDYHPVLNVSNGVIDSTLTYIVNNTGSTENDSNMRNEITPTEYEANISWKKHSHERGNMTTLVPDISTSNLSSNPFPPSSDVTEKKNTDERPEITTALPDIYLSFEKDIFPKKEIFDLFDFNEIYPPAERAQDDKIHPVIYAKPGENLIVPPMAEVILPCPSSVTREDITWKDSEKMLFLGSLDLTGLEGVALSSDGSLRLLPDISGPKDRRTYTCLVFDYSIYEDVPIATYQVDLISDDRWTNLVQSKSRNEVLSKPPSLTPSPKFKFLGLGDLNIAVLANHIQIGETLTRVLTDNGMNAVYITGIMCNSSKSLLGWESTLQAVKECEILARDVGLIEINQPVFATMDFAMNLGPFYTYASNLIYIHNTELGMTSHVFGAFVPIMSNSNWNTVVPIQCGSPIYSVSSQGVSSWECERSISSSVTNLEKAYSSLYQAAQINNDN